VFVNFALLCPGALLLVWALIFAFKKKDSLRKKVLLALAVICALQFTAEGFLLSQDVGNSTLAHLELLRQTTGPMKLPLLIIYYRILSGRKPIGWDYYVWFFLIVAQTAVACTLFVVIKPENVGAFIRSVVSGADPSLVTNRMYLGWVYLTMHSYSYILLAQLIFVGYEVIIAFRHHPFSFKEMIKVWKGESSRIQAFAVPVTLLLVLVAMARRLLGDVYLINHIEVAACFSIAMAILMHLIAYVCNMKRTDPYELAEQMFDDPLNDDPDITEATREQKVFIVEAFERLMNDKQMYLESDVTIESVAKAIGTNRTYISRMVRNRYNCTFREYINSRRIKYAKEFMLRNPESLLEYVAGQCGYMSTSAFSKNFQQQEGMPPRLWVMNRQADILAKQQ